jgi:hypothetical protein
MDWGSGFGMIYSISRTSGSYPDPDNIPDPNPILDLRQVISKGAKYFEIYTSR